MRAVALIAVGTIAASAYFVLRRYGSALPFAGASSEAAGDVPAADAAIVAPDFVQPIELGTAGVLDRTIAAVSESARKLFALPSAAAPYAKTIATAEQQHGIPPSLLGRVLYQESQFRDDIITGRTRSAVGAVGIAQFMPKTAAELGVNPLDPYQSIDGAARYLAQLYRTTGDWVKAVAAYNWGIGNVQRKGIDAAPAETQAYITDIFNDVTV